MISVRKIDDIKYRRKETVVVVPPGVLIMIDESSRFKERCNNNDVMTSLPKSLAVNTEHSHSHAMWHLLQPSSSLYTTVTTRDRYTCNAHSTRPTHTP